MFGTGIDKMGCLLDAAEAAGIVDRKGSWYSRGQTRFAQGRRSSVEFLRDNLDIAKEVESAVLACLSSIKPTFALSNTDDDDSDSEPGTLEKDDPASSPIS